MILTVYVLSLWRDSNLSSNLCQWVPFVNVYKNKDGGIERIAGPMANLLEIISENLNFKYRLIPGDEDKWGIEDKDGNFNGMLGQIQRNEIDFALGPFAVSEVRYKVADFTVVLHKVDQVIMTPRPQLENDILGFLKPFSLQLWFCILVSLFVVTVIHFLFCMTEHNIKNDKKIPTLGNSFFWALETITQHVLDWHLDTISCRLLTATWMLSSLVLSCIYGGLLTALLTVPTVNIPIDNLQDLVNQDEYPFKVESSSAFYEYLELSESGVQKEAFEKLSGTLYSSNDAWPSVKDRKLVFVSDRLSVTTMLGKDFSTSGKCHLYIASEPAFAGFSLSIAVLKNSSLLQKLNYGISKMTEAGLFMKWIQEQQSNVTACLRHPSQDDNSEEKILPLSSFVGCFILIALGFSLALSVFIGEISKNIPLGNEILRKFLECKKTKKTGINSN